jgi:hypothetical protein
MIMDDPQVTALPPERPKRKYRRRMVAPATQGKQKSRTRGISPSDDEFAGLTLRSCCSGCNPETGCIISGDICVHPMMSGCLQAAHKMKPPVMAKFDRAKQLLERQALDVRQSRDREQPGRL